MIQALLTKDSQTGDVHVSIPVGTVDGLIWARARDGNAREGMIQHVIRMWQHNLMRTLEENLLFDAEDEIVDELSGSKVQTGRSLEGP